MKITITQNSLKEILKYTKQLSGQGSSIFLDESKLEMVSSLPIGSYTLFTINAAITERSRQKIKMPYETFMDLLKITFNKDDLTLNLDTSKGIITAKSSKRTLKTSDYSLVDSTDSIPVYEFPVGTHILDQNGIKILNDHKNLFMGNTTVLSKMNGIFINPKFSYSTNSYSILKIACAGALRSKDNIFIPSHVYTLLTSRDNSELYVDLTNSKMIVSNDLFISVFSYNIADDDMFTKLESVFSKIDPEVITVSADEMLSSINSSTIVNLKPKKVTLEFNGFVSVSMNSSSNMSYVSDFAVASNGLSQKCKSTLPADELSILLGIVEGYSSVDIKPNSDRVIGFEFGNCTFVVGTTKSGD